MSTKPNPKQQLPWQESEFQQFFAYYELYGNDFHSYTQHLNKTYSQIKSFFHNWFRKQPADVQLKYKVGLREGSHKAYRNSVSVKDLDQTVQQLKYLEEITGRKPQQ
ncbi:SANT/Myb_domain [Hexamita inflata]|uniref:SANT/Myb_domain n=1 Tax=Hexamita inflata TaxID=28002 RepID=A0ABP1HQR6_9EUKA